MLPTEGCVLHLGEERRQARARAPVARDLIDTGLPGHRHRRHRRLPHQSRACRVERVNKVAEGRPHIVDAMKNGEVQLVFNTTEGAQSYRDSHSHPPHRADPEHPILHDGVRGPGGRSRPSGGLKSARPLGVRRPSSLCLTDLDRTGYNLPIPRRTFTHPHGKNSNDRRGLSSPRRRTEASQDRRAPDRDRRRSRKRAPMATSPRTPSTMPPRSARRSSKRRLAEIEDKIARAADHRHLQALGQTGEIRRDRPAARRGFRREGQIQDRRRGRVRREGGKISITSPIARALIGKEEGDVVEVMAPGGAKSYEIVKVKYL